MIYEGEIIALKLQVMFNEISCTESSNTREVCVNMFQFNQVDLAFVKETTAKRLRVYICICICMYIYIYIYIYNISVGLDEDVNEGFKNLE